MRKCNALLNEVFYCKLELAAHLGVPECHIEMIRRCNFEMFQHGCVPFLAFHWVKKLLKNKKTMDLFV